MERFDYPSVMAVLMEHMPREAYGSQVALLELLYAGYVEDTGHVFDNGQVNKWLKGKERFSPKVSTYYMEQKHRYDLCAAIEGKLLPMMDDPAMAAQELYELLSQDSGVSEQKKAEPSEGSDFENLEEIAVFLTQLLCFAMTRNLEKHMANRAAGLSPVTRERILGGKIPLLCKWFRGREQEIEQLHELLMAEDKVFLHGIPGIGKSEMAKAYVKRYRNEYTNVLYLAYGGSLRHSIAELEFSDDLSTDDEKRRFQKHDRYLRTLKEDTLLIIDNFNTMPEEDDYFDTILRWQCRILFSTRNRFEDRTGLELKELETEALFQMTVALYSDAKQNCTVISDIIQILHRHTFAVELAARLLEKGILKPTALRRKLRLERVAMDAADLIRTLKDGKSSRATYHDHIRTLFALFRLSAKKKDILRNMTLTPETGVDAKTFARWLKLPDLNGINELIELGLIRPEREQKILLHPMICEAALDELPPSIRKCHVLIESIHWICRLHGMEEPHYRQMFHNVERIMEEAEKDDAPAYLLFLEDVFLYMEKYHYETGIRRILEEMESLLEKDSFGTASDRALVLDYRAAMEKSKPRAIELEIEAIRLLGEVDQKTAHLAANLHSNLGGLYHQVGRIDLAKLHMEQGWFLLREYDLLHYHDSITQVVNYAMLLSETKEFDRGIEALNKVDAYLREGALNVFLRELRRQMERIAKAVLDTIPAIARALEALRQKLLMLQYQVLHYRSAAWQAADDLRDIKPDLARFDTLTAEIKAKTAQQRTLTNEKKQTLAWSLLKKRDLTQRINALAEELKDLHTEKNRILASFDLTDDKDMNEIRKWTKQQETAIQTLNTQESRCQADLNTALEEYKTLSTHAANFDPNALWPERLRERKNLTNEARATLQARFGAEYSERRLEFAERQIREMLPKGARELRQYGRETQARRKKPPKFRDVLKTQ